MLDVVKEKKFSYQSDVCIASFLLFSSHSRVSLIVKMTGKSFLQKSLQTKIRNIYVTEEKFYFMILFYIRTGPN